VLQLYDTRTGQARPVGQARRGELRMYTCGPTVYRYAHVGNLRSYLLSDLIRRAAELHGLQVMVCQNIHLIDVHTGGIDLRFPHHADERAGQAWTVRAT